MRFLLTQTLSFNFIPLLGGDEDDKPKKPKPPKPPPPARTISESSGNEASESSDVKKVVPEVKKVVPEAIPEVDADNKPEDEAAEKKEEDAEVEKEEEEKPPEGIKASVAFKWKKAMVNVVVEFSSNSCHFG